MFDIINVTLASPVADNGTFTAAFPTGRGAGSYTGAYAHKLIANGTTYSAPRDFTLAFTTLITVTWKADVTLPAGTTLALQVERVGVSEHANAESKSYPNLAVTLIPLGAPIAADADGICASQSINTGTPGVINGALATGGVATFDVPRNVVAAWTGTAVITITGKDVYGNTVVESSASGTSLAGKKAFKTITKVEVSANVTSATVGSGDVLGLPFRLPGTAYVLKELEDGAAPTAGTVVAAVNTVATATTGDVRGTYDPNSAADGAKSFQLIVVGADTADLGVSQYAG